MAGRGGWQHVGVQRHLAGVPRGGCRWAPRGCGDGDGDGDGDRVRSGDGPSTGQAARVPIPSPPRPDASRGAPRRAVCTAPGTAGTEPGRNAVTQRLSGPCLVGTPVLGAGLRARGRCCVSSQRGGRRQAWWGRFPPEAGPQPSSSSEEPCHPVSRHPRGAGLGAAEHPQPSGRFRAPAAAGGPRAGGSSGGKSCARLASIPARPGGRVGRLSICFRFLPRPDLRNFLSLPAFLSQTATAGPGRHRVINEPLCPRAAREAAPRQRGSPGARGASGKAGGSAFWGGGGLALPSSRAVNAARCFLAHLQSRQESICRPRSGWAEPAAASPRGAQRSRGQPQALLPAENPGPAGGRGCTGAVKHALTRGSGTPSRPDGPFPPGKRGDTERPRASLQNI